MDKATSNYLPDANEQAHQSPT